MVVPSNKLLLWTGILIPAAALGALLPATAVVCVMLYSALVLIAVVDAVLAARSTRRVRIALPEVVRLSQHNPGEIPLLLSNDTAAPLRLVVGLPLPETVVSPEDELSVDLAGENRAWRSAWPCTPHVRGRFRVDRCHYQISSPCGLWNARNSCPTRAEARVYPNLGRERKNLSALFLNRGNFGLHTHRMVGQGRDFEKLREYIPGDSYDDIHWKATAKRGRPITKLFQIERTQEVYVAVDTSRLSARAIDSTPLLERFISSALALGLVAEKQGDLFGLITFNSRVTNFIRASAGKAHHTACQDALYTLSSNLVTPDFDELVSFVRLRLRRRALLVILTDLEDPMLAESFLRGIRLISRHHVILVFTVKRAGVGPLFSETGADSVDSLYTRVAGHILWRTLGELGRNLQRRGVRFLLADNDKLVVDMVTQYMNIKARQIL